MTVESNGGGKSGNERNCAASRPMWSYTRFLALLIASNQFLCLRVCSSSSLFVFSPPSLRLCFCRWTHDINSKRLWIKNKLNWFHFSYFSERLFRLWRASGASISKSIKLKCDFCRRVQWILCCLLCCLWQFFLFSSPDYDEIIYGPWLMVLALSSSSTASLIIFSFCKYKYLYNWMRPEGRKNTPKT